MESEIRLPDLTIQVTLRNFPADSDDDVGGPDPRRPGIAEESWREGERRRYVIQFREALSPEAATDLQDEFGLSLDAPIADFSYIEQIDEETYNRLQQRNEQQQPPAINSIFRLTPALKIAPAIGFIDFETPSRQDIRDEKGLLVEAALFPDVADPKMVAAEIAQLGATETRVLDDRALGGLASVQFIVASTGALPVIAALESVSWIEEVPEEIEDAGIPNDILQSGGVNGVPFTDKLLRGQHQRIGLLERGSLDIKHCWFNDGDKDAGEDHRKVAAEHDETGLGIHKHSAFVAGILCGDDSDETAAVRGVACNARIVYGNREDYIGGATDLTLLDYLKKAEAAKAHIHNNSWHSVSQVDYSLMAARVDGFASSFEDCLIVASSGRIGKARGAPGTAKNSLCVSAAYVGPEGSCFGNGRDGPTEDGRRKPDLLAPGCAIESAISESECDVDLDDIISDDPLVEPCCAEGETFCATSFATPVVSGAAAIARQYFVEGWYPTGSPESAELKPSGALLKATLLNATAPVSGSGNCDDLGYPNDRDGWGLLQLDRVLYLGEGNRKVQVWDVRHEEGLTSDAGNLSREFEFTVLPDTGEHVPLKVTLVWADPPPLSTNDAKIVVNDLNLAVTEPDGSTTYLGNVFDGGVSVTGGEPDALNNVEMVFLSDPDPGLWTITVSAESITLFNGARPQGFALVVTANMP